MCKECKGTPSCSCVCLDQDISEDYYGKTFCSRCGCPLELELEVPAPAV